ncbi:MAG: TolA-binding protein [Flavobacteriaceae bacterium]|jgi:TolA-binding protein
MELKPRAMKVFVGLILAMSVGAVNAQSESLKKERYERYENGELIEQDFNIEKDGVPQENYDFENDSFFSKKPTEGMDADFSKQFGDMEQKMAEMQQKMSSTLDEQMRKMDTKMKEMQKRSEKMQNDMKKRMDSKDRGFEDRQPRDLKQKPSQAPIINQRAVQTFGA